MGVITDISYLANQPAWVDENKVDLALALQPNYVGASITVSTPKASPLYQPQPGSLAAYNLAWLEFPVEVIRS